MGLKAAIEIRMSGWGISSLTDQTPNYIFYSRAEDVYFKEESVLLGFPSFSTLYYNVCL